jgi:hypothetical protein
MLEQCPDCAGAGTNGELEPFFANDAPVETVVAGVDGWLSCPGCARRFSPRDAQAWTGQRHIRCGQRIRVAG